MKGEGARPGTGAKLRRQAGATAGATTFLDVIKHIRVNRARTETSASEVSLPTLVVGECVMVARGAQAWRVAEAYGQHE